MSLKLHEKIPLPGNKYEFIFIDGKSRIRGISFQQDGKTNFDNFKVGQTHVVEGGLKAQTRKRQYTTNSTSKYELLLFKVRILSISTGPGVSNAENEFVGIAKIRNILEHGRKFKGFLEYLENVSIEDGQVYRYLGCVTCQTSIQLQGGNYYCRKCSGKIEQSNLKVFTMIRNQRIKDSTGKVLDGITMFHNWCEKLIPTEALNNISDSACRNAFAASIGTRLNLRIEVKYNNTLKYGTHFSLIAKEMDIISGRPTIPIDRSETFVADAAPIITEEPNPNERVVATDEQIALVMENSISSSNQMTVNDIIGMTVDKYELNSIPPGYTLIVNNIDFQSPNLKRREGSMEDVKNLCRLFPDLKMPIYKTPFINVSKAQLMEILGGFKLFLDEQGASSCNVVIMSHGTQNSIEMIDESVNFYLDILPLFSDVRFPAFRLKPKMFFPLGCQGFPAEAQLLNPNNAVLPPYSDVMICLPQLPGYPSFRHPTKGSVFVVALCKVFRALARSMDFEKMLKKVAQICSCVPIMSSVDESSPNSEMERHRQISCSLPILFSREFYFKLD